MYSAKLTGLKAKDVMLLISTMPAHVDCKFAQTPAEVTPEKLNGRSGVGLNDCIMLGDFEQARVGSLKRTLVDEVMIYEKEYGAGEMTKRKLRDKLKAHSAAPDAVIGAALKAGIIKGA